MCGWIVPFDDAVAAAADDFIVDNHHGPDRNFTGSPGGNCFPDGFRHEFTVY